MSIVIRLYKWLRKRILKIDDRSQLEIAVANGLKMGSNVHVMGDCILDPGHCWLIEIGNNVTLAPRVHVLAHDASTQNELGKTKIGLVSIGNEVFVGASTIILPNTHIGDKVVIGAGSVVTKDIPSNSVAVGNPARVIMSYDQYMAKNKKMIENRRSFDGSYIIGTITDEKKQEMIRELQNGIGFIV